MTNIPQITSRMRHGTILPGQCQFDEDCWRDDALKECHFDDWLWGWACRVSEELWIRGTNCPVYGHVFAGRALKRSYSPGRRHEARVQMGSEGRGGRVQDRLCSVRESRLSQRRRKRYIDLKGLGDRLNEGQVEMTRDRDCETTKERDLARMCSSGLSNLESD